MKIIKKIKRFKEKKEHRKEVGNKYFIESGNLMKNYYEKKYGTFEEAAISLEEIEDDEIGKKHE